MNGSEAMVHTLLNGGVDVCFGNPGTSEMHFVSALDAIPKMRCILGLFEGVITGAADGYYRIADKPAATLLHLGPGLANGLANLHNAKRAGSGVVNIVGQHAVDHLANDAPLTSDIEGLARPMSHWVRTTMSADAAPSDTAAAIAQARATPGQIATLILPADAAWGPCAAGANSVPAESGPRRIDMDRVDAIARVIREAREPGRVALLLGGRGMRARATEWAGRLAAKCGVRLLCETKSARTERGRGRVNIPKIPYPFEPSLALLKEVSTLILAGAPNPVAFFAYPDKPRFLMPPGSAVHTLATPADDIEGMLEALCDALGCRSSAPALIGQPRDFGPLPAGKPTSEAIGHVMAACMPENTIVVDEAITTGRMLHNFTASAAPHDWLEITGGSLGYGLPAAVGAAVAAPNRKVLAIIGDGTAMYTLQSLWTMARENLDVTVVICANRVYRILFGELDSMGKAAPGPSAKRMLTLDGPVLDWVSIAKGHGVDARRAEDLAAFATALQDAMNSRGPRLIELVL